MSSPEEQSLVLKGCSGNEYLVPVDAMADRANGQISPIEGGEGEEFIAFPESLCTRVVEQSLQRQLEENRYLSPLILYQISSIVDIVYKDGDFVGAVGTTLERGMSLEDYLQIASVDRRSRYRTAQNFCVLVHSLPVEMRDTLDCAGERLRIDPSSCRVFLQRDFLSLARARSESSPSRERKGRSAQCVEIAKIAYLLLRRDGGARLARQLFGESAAPASHDVNEENDLVLIEQSIRCPLSVRVTAFMRRNPQLLRNLWDVPAEFRSVLLSSLRGEIHDVDGLINEIYVKFLKLERKRTSAFEVLIERGRRFLRGAYSREAAVECERQAWGAHSHRSPYSFWGTTLFVSFMIGLCSAMNGFSPLDPLLCAVLGRVASSFGTRYVVQYIVIAMVGCAAFNLLVARRHHLHGYGRGVYFLSIASATAFLSLTKVAFSIMAEGGAL